MNLTGRIALCPNRFYPLIKYGLQEGWHLAQRPDDEYAAGAGPTGAVGVTGLTLEPDSRQPGVPGCERVDLDVVTHIGGIGRGRTQEPAGMVESTGVRLAKA